MAKLHGHQMSTVAKLITFYILIASVLLYATGHDLYMLNAVRCPYVMSVTLGVAISVASDVIMRIACFVAADTAQRYGD